MTRCSAALVGPSSRICIISTEWGGRSAGGGVRIFQFDRLKLVARFASIGLEARVRN
jgi:hypothetical protein